MTTAPHNALDLLNTIDAAKWAATFVETFPEANYGTMIGWFANAIETGRSHPRARTEAGPREDYTIGDETDVATVVFTALGAASMAWQYPYDGGVFESDYCKSIGDALVAFINER